MKLTVRQLIDILDTFFENDDEIESIGTTYGLSISYKRDDVEFRFSADNNERYEEGRE